MMIPKKIHYCWFGGNDLSPMSIKCMDSWRAKLPDFEILRWDEKNSNISDPIVSYALKRKMWAFAADFVRLKVLYEHGGIYLDTDMELVQSLSPLLDNACFFGAESDGVISCGVIGARPKNPFIAECIKHMEQEFSAGKKFVTMPRIITSAYRRSRLKGEVKIYSRHVFYPFNPYDSQQPVKQLLYQDVTPDTFAIHHWEKSWKQGLLYKTYYKFNNISVALLSRLFK